jgi:hypothetical protein
MQVRGREILCKGIADLCNGGGGRVMGYYDGDPWSNHVLNEIKCAECEEYFDQQEEEGGNICPPCILRERASK